MEYEWDAAKDAENRRKHRLALADGIPALEDPDAQPFLDREAAGMTKLVNVKKLRERLGQTQEQFAATYRIPVGTLRDWEQRRKHPDAPARAYLQVIAKDPQAVAALLQSAA